MLIATFALNCLTDEVEEQVRRPHQPNGLLLLTKLTIQEANYLKIVRLPRIARCAFLRESCVANLINVFKIGVAAATRFLKGRPIGWAV